MRLSRRALFAYAPAVGLAAASPTLFASAQEQDDSDGIGSLRGLPAIGDSISKAFAFQDFMMDAYATGATVRLAQSYSDQALGATAFTYDNAVAIQAYLASGNSSLEQRAIVLGEGLLYGQAHPYPFPISDGRFPQAFFVNVPTSDGAYVTPAATPYYFYSSSVGDQAWAGMALAQIYARTRQQRFLDGALLVAEWIVNNTYDTVGAGGYRFGTIIAYINYQNVSQPSPDGKSTEHNIDTYAFFRMLAALTGNAQSQSRAMTWSQLADHALTFVEAMYNPAGPYFWTGTLGDQVTINTSPIPEDTQTWSYLSLEKNRYKATIDWALANLEATDTTSAPHNTLTGNERFHGMVFDTASLTSGTDDPDAVWLEGTGHMIAALAARVVQGNENLGKRFQDLSTALGLVRNSIKAQAQLGAGQAVGGKPIPQGEGLVAATSPMDTGFGYSYGPSLHIGATGWYLLGVQGANPFQLGYQRPLE